MQKKSWLPLDCVTSVVHNEINTEMSEGRSWHRSNSCRSLFRNEMRTDNNHSVWLLLFSWVWNKAPCCMNRLPKNTVCTKQQWCNTDTRTVSSFHKNDAMLFSYLINESEVKKFLGFPHFILFHIAFLYTLFCHTHSPPTAITGCILGSEWKHWERREGKKFIWLGFVGLS